MRRRPAPTAWTALPLVILLWACGGEGPPSSGEGAPGAAEEHSASDVAAVEARAAGGPAPASGPPLASVVLDALFAPGGPRPLLTPCGTDRVLTVEDAAAAAELERRVRLERPGTEGPVRVTVRGGAGEGVFRLEEVVRVHRADDCPEAPAARPLEGTAWQLSGLPEPDPAVRAAGAWLRMDGEVGGLEGSTGCAALVGRYDWNVTRLRFAGLDPAAPPCREAALHRAFLDALARTGSYRVDGDVLVLLGEEGAVATFRAPEP